jgi:type II secretory pathway pseudopilin PulG
MQKTRKYGQLNLPARNASAFTLMETVIAIGVLAVLLTGFIAVFTPAAQGIRRSISSQQADRLTSTLERELVTLRSGQNPATATTGFEKGFTWIKEGNAAANAIFVYQYRGDPSTIRTDGTPQPVATITGQPGTDYIVQSMARRADDDFFEGDLTAIEGAIFFVKPTQLVFEGNEMVLSKTPGQISYLENGAQIVAADANAYKDAVIAFSAEFYSVPTKSISYLTGTAFATRFANDKIKPVFTRNLAIRR